MFLDRMAEDAPCPSVGTLQTLAAAFGYAELGPFWQALHAAAQTMPKAATSRHAPQPDLSDGEATLLVAYRGCTPEQQMIITSIAAIYAAQHAVAAKGEAALVDVGAIVDSEAMITQAVLEDAAAHHTADAPNALATEEHAEALGEAPSTDAAPPSEALPRGGDVAVDAATTVIAVTPIVDPVTDHDLMALLERRDTPPAKAAEEDWRTT